MKINDLLDEVKHANGLNSDGELARKLDVDKRRVSDYRKGERVPDEFACLKIAEALGQPLDTIIARVKAATEKDEKRREVWENYMKRLGGLAAMVMVGVLWAFCAVVTMKVTSSEAEANDHKASPAAAEGSSLYYVKYNTQKKRISSDPPP